MEDRDERLLTWTVGGDGNDWAAAGLDVTHVSLWTAPVDGDPIAYGTVSGPLRVRKRRRWIGRPLAALARLLDRLAHRWVTEPAGAK